MPTADIRWRQRFDNFQRALLGRTMTSRRRRDRQLLPHCFWVAHFWYRRWLSF
jgi:hypothetical protein